MTRNLRTNSENVTSDTKDEGTHHILSSYQDEIRDQNEPCTNNSQCAQGLLCYDDTNSKSCQYTYTCYNKALENLSYQTRNFLTNQIISYVDYMENFHRENPNDTLKESVIEVDIEFQQELMDFAYNLNECSVSNSGVDLRAPPDGTQLPQINIGVTLDFSFLIGGSPTVVRPFFEATTW